MAVLRALSSIVVLQAIGAVLSFGLVIALTAVMGTSGYGVFAWTLSMGYLGALVLQAGLPITIVKRYAPLDLAAERSASPLSDTFTLFVGVTIAGVGVVAALDLAAPTLPTVVWAVPLACGLATLKIGTAILRSAGQPVRAQSAEQLVRVALIALMLAAGALLGIGDPGFYLLAYCIGATMATGVFLRPLFNRGAFKGMHQRKLVKPDPSHFQVALSQSIGNHLPVFVTGFFIDPSTLSYLAISLQLTGPVTFGLIAARSYYGYSINTAIRAKNPLTAWRLYLGAIGISNMVSIPLAGVLLIGLNVHAAQLMSIKTDMFQSALFFHIFAGVLAFRCAQCIFGPAQMVGILAGNERFVKHSNVFLLGIFTISLFIAANIALQATTLVMIAYAFALNLSIFVRCLLYFSGKRAWRLVNVS